MGTTWTTAAGVETAAGGVHPKSGQAVSQQVGRRVLLCGSMKTLPVMEELLGELSAAGIEALAPRPDSAYVPSKSPSAVVRAKREASADHFTKIKDSQTWAILVVNIDREGNPDYIGPNSFAEIAVAFAEGREVFLFQGMPEIYAEELTAWGAHCLHGNLDRLQEYFAALDPPPGTSVR